VLSSVFAPFARGGAAPFAKNCGSGSRNAGLRRGVRLKMQGSDHPIRFDRVEIGIFASHRAWSDPSISGRGEENRSVDQVLGKQRMFCKQMLSACAKWVVPLSRFMRFDPDAYPI